MNFDNIVRAAEKFKNKVLKTPLEQLLEEATSDENWSCPNKLLNELAESSFQYQDYSVIMKHIENRLDTNKTKKWRKIEKTLSLIDHLIKFGAQRCIGEFKDNIYLIGKLKNYQANENGQDKGAAIREKATNLISMLEDEERLKQVIKDAQALKSKLSGIGGMSYTSNKYAGFGSDNYDTYVNKDNNNQKLDKTNDIANNYGGKNELGGYDDFDWEKKIQSKNNDKRVSQINQTKPLQETQEQQKSVQKQQEHIKKFVKIIPPSQNNTKQNVNQNNNNDNLFDFDEADTKEK